MVKLQSSRMKTKKRIRIRVPFLIQSHFSDDKDFCFVKFVNAKKEEGKTGWGSVKLDNELRQMLKEKLTLRLVDIENNQRRPE